MAAVLHDYRDTGGGEQFRNGLLRSRPFRDVVLRGAEHRLLPLEDEQSPRHHHVPLLLRIRSRFAWVRVRDNQVSRLSPR